MAHIGFTPQSEHQLGGFRVQGRGDNGPVLVEAARALEAAGAFAVLIEMVPADVAAQITAAVSVPTVGIGAGSDCDAQVLVWQDMAGLRTGQLPRFVKQYADMHGCCTRRPASSPPMWKQGSSRGRNTRSSRNRPGQGCAPVSAQGAQHFFDQNHITGHEVELQQGRMLLGD